MDPDTKIGGVGGRFPATRASAVLGVRSKDPSERERALDTLVAAYWKPVYTHLRLRWRLDNEDAKDLTQGFFARALEQESLAGYEPSRGTFRTFLRVCVDRFASNEHVAGKRLKRGGGAEHLSLDFDAAELEVAALARDPARSPDEQFEREWARSLFALGLAELEQVENAAGRTLAIELFRRYDLEADGPERRPTYQQLAEELGITATQVTNHLHAIRQRLREILLERLRAITADEREFETEARALFGPR